MCGELMLMLSRKHTYPNIMTPHLAITIGPTEASVEHPECICAIWCGLGSFVHALNMDVCLQH